MSQEFIVGKLHNHRGRRPHAESWTRFTRAVPARLGLEAPALAWPEGASAF